MARCDLKSLASRQPSYPVVYNTDTICQLCPNLERCKYATFGRLKSVGAVSCVCAVASTHSSWFPYGCDTAITKP